MPCAPGANPAQGGAGRACHVQGDLRMTLERTAAARPKAMTPLILSRYRAGQTYGLHVDDALMGGLRTDLSFTLFLTPPGDYDGGELTVHTAGMTQDVKGEAGYLVLYPSSSIHQVKPVTRGERIVCVGWIGSDPFVVLAISLIAFYVSTALANAIGRFWGNLVGRFRDINPQTGAQNFWYTIFGLIIAFVGPAIGPGVVFTGLIQAISPFLWLWWARHVYHNTDYSRMKAEANIEPAAPRLSE
jgi:hypothetical protein